MIVGDETLGGETLGYETLGYESLGGVPESSSSTSDFSSISILTCSMLFEGNLFAELSLVILLKAMIGVFLVFFLYFLGFFACDEISVSFLALFLLTFLLFIFSKTSASRMSCSGNFYGCCGSCSRVL